MKAVRIVLASALLVLPMAALSRAPFTFADGDSAWLRFSWRMSVTGDEECRPRTEAELNELPVHMRTPLACTRTEAAYMLITRIDELPADTVHLARGGVKADRPIFVLAQRRLAPGPHSVSVALQRTSADTARVLAALDTALVLEPGTIQLLTLEEGTRFVVRSAASSTPR